MMISKTQSWGKQVGQNTTLVPVDRSSIDFDGNQSVLPFGVGRSYGDSCLNANGKALLSTSFNQVLSFDHSHGVIRAEAGVLLKDLISLIVPHGWFFAVTPGTQFVTLGGALANDVHGKNHIHQGSFGCHVTQFKLMRSNGHSYICSRTQNRDLFFATIGGLGLTGFIAWVEFKLMKIATDRMITKRLRYNTFDQLLNAALSIKNSSSYTIAWIDLFKQYRGVLMTSEHVTSSDSSNLQKWNASRALKFGTGFRVPAWFPRGILNRWTGRVFNSIQYFGTQSFVTQKIPSFFYPLDALQNWNHLYGKPGFFQYQCVVPYERLDVLPRLFERVRASKVPCFLAALKFFGGMSSGGWLSFPRNGATVSLDFPNLGAPVLELMKDMDEEVLAVSGAVYPAKDARMSSEMFKVSFPKWNDFLELKDPKFSSDFWRRVVPNHE